MTEPRVIIFAGPNGSGKSTVIEGFAKAKDFPKIYINADDIARQELQHIEGQRSRDMRSAVLAHKRRMDALESGQPFAFETVMSNPKWLYFFDTAKTKGYEVSAVVVTTESSNINLARVEGRVSKGGHFVSPRDIVERYNQVMKLLPSIAERADSLAIYDNSINGRSPLLVATKEEKLINIHSTEPSWVVPKLRNPLQQRGQSRQALTREAQKGNPNIRITVADIGNNNSYSGPVVGITDHHILQKIGNSFVLHDRLLVPSRLECAVGKPLTIPYSFGPDGKHQALEKDKEVKQEQNRGMGF